MKKILSLPPFMVHEDTVVSFRNMLKAGKFWIDGETNISYLLIKGDGTWGARLLMLHEDGKLYMVVYQGIIDGGGQKFSLYLYNEKEKAMVCIGSFEESLFGK